MFEKFNPFIMREYLVNLSNYNLWANSRICHMIPDDTKIWEGPVASSFPDIRQTLLHIWDAETIWLMRLNEEPIKEWPGKFFKGDHKEIIKGLVGTSHAFFSFLDKQLPAYPTKIIQYKNLKGEHFSNTSAEIVAHTMNHSTFHRGQVITMLRNLGITDLLATDMIAYYRERSQLKSEIPD